MVVSSPPPPVPLTARVQQAPFAAPLVPSPPQQKRSKAWLWAIISSLIAGLLICAGTILQDSFPEASGAFKIGVTIGSAVFVIAVALLVAAVVSGILAIFKNPFRKTLAPSYCITVLVIAGLYFLGSGAISLGRKTAANKAAKAESDRQTIEGIESDTRAMLENMDDNGEGGPLSFDAGPIPEDDLAKVRHMTRNLYNEIATTQREYNAALERDGLTKLLDSERLASDEAMGESRAILARVDKVVKVYREKMRVLTSSAPDRLRKYRMDPKTKREVLEGMKKSQVESPDYHGQTWDLEEQSLRHMGELIDHLDKTRADWVVSEGVITFTTDEDVETYNAIMAEMDACSAKQTKLRESAMESMKADVESAKSALPK